jgi:hypothetical protein
VSGRLSRLGFAATLAALLYFLPAGCGYRLGSSLPPGIRTVHVPTFINRTGEPQLEVETTRATVQEFQKDGTLKVVKLGNEDAVLTVRLVSFELEPLRYERVDAKTTTEYRLKIVAEIGFKRTSNGQILIRRRVMGKSTFDPLGDLTSAKLDAVPAAARDLAHEIVKSVVEYW